MEYKEYLKTEHWKTLASETKRLAGGRCQVCNSTELLETHHRTYERKGDELQSDLVCLCHKCHSLFELGFRRDDETLQNVHNLLVSEHQRVLQAVRYLAWTVRDNEKAMQQIAEALDITLKDLTEKVNA